MPCGSRRADRGPAIDLSFLDTGTARADSERALLAGLREMLELGRPDLLDVERSSVQREDADLEVTLAHGERDDWNVVIAIAGEEAIVFFRAAHVHFGRWADDAEEPAWTQRAVDFVAALLRGDVQVDALWSGEELLRARHARRDRDGDSVARGSSVYFSPGWLRPWRMRRTSERPSFMKPSP